MDKEKGEEKKKIVLPKELQIEMMNFFLKTSIPRRIKREKNISLSDRKTGDEYEEKS